MLIDASKLPLSFAFFPALWITFSRLINEITDEINQSDKSLLCCGEQIKPKAEANNCSARHRHHLITEFVCLMNILGKRSDLPFSRKSDRKKEKSMVSFTHEQNIICSQTLLDGIAHEQIIICRQLFAGQVANDNVLYLCFL